MNLLGSLGKPEYLFRPSQIVRRLARERSPAGEFEEVVLPWGIRIRLRPAESMGSCIWRVGVYDLSVSECIWRLLEPGENAVDVGANIGYMTGLMAARVGRDGSVTAFEPHPQIFQELEHNVEEWRQQSGMAPIRTHRLALAENPGEGQLRIPIGFKENRGLATLAADAEAEQGVAVQVERLDRLCAPDYAIALLKVDVEGHELSVLRGGEGLVARKTVRDIVFEEHAEPPTPVTRWLQEKGYSIFHLDRNLLGPTPVPLGAHRVAETRPEAPSLLATLAPERALARLSGRGWKSLASR